MNNSILNSIKETSKCVLLCCWNHTSPTEYFRKTHFNFHFLQQLPSACPWARHLPSSSFFSPPLLWLDALLRMRIRVLERSKCAFPLSWIEKPSKHVRNLMTGKEKEKMYASPNTEYLPLCCSRGIHFRLFFICATDKRESAEGLDSRKDMIFYRKDSVCSVRGLRKELQAARGISTFLLHTSICLLHFGLWREQCNTCSSHVPSSLFGRQNRLKKGIFYLFSFFFYNKLISCTSGTHIFYFSKSKKGKRGPFSNT